MRQGCLHALLFFRWCDVILFQQERRSSACISFYCFVFHAFYRLVPIFACWWWIWGVTWSSPLCLLWLWWWDRGRVFEPLHYWWAFLLSLSLITIFDNWANWAFLVKRWSPPPTQVCTCVQIDAHGLNADTQTSIVTVFMQEHICRQARSDYKCTVFSFSLSSSLPLIIISCSVQCSDITVLCEQRLMVQCVCRGRAESTAGVCCREPGRRHGHPAADKTHWHICHWHINTATPWLEVGKSMTNDALKLVR